jgi:hypothetical protein
MPKIHLMILGHLAFRSSRVPPSAIMGKRFSFVVTQKGSTVKVEILPIESSTARTLREERGIKDGYVQNSCDADIQSSREAEVSDELFEALNNGAKTELALPKSVQSEYGQLFDTITDASNRVARLLKYGLDFADLLESPFTEVTQRWSIDGLNWKSITRTIHLVGVWDPDRIVLDDETANQIQDYIDTDYEPFFSLVHLHRAKNDPDPRYKWIYATIAAELAIKEFLIAKFPELEVLLLELPSPPLTTLYGKILKSYTGQKGNMTVMEEGIKTRNKLLHRPKAEIVSLEKAKKYVRDVEVSIFQLMHMLYPNDRLIERLYEHIKPHH